jgi:hypothetical protein
MSSGIGPHTGIHSAKSDSLSFGLGCKLGRSVFMAACQHPWRRCVGLEIYEPRHRLGLQALKR